MQARACFEVLQHFSRCGRVAAYATLERYLLVAPEKHICQLTIIVDGIVDERRLREDGARQPVEHTFYLLLGGGCGNLNGLTVDRDARMHDGVFYERFGLLAVLGRLLLLALDDVALGLRIVAARTRLSVLFDARRIVEQVVVVAFGIEHQKRLLGGLHV